jgi:hypothetical protein
MGKGLARGVATWRTHVVVVVCEHGAVLGVHAGQAVHIVAVQAHQPRAWALA